MMRMLMLETNMEKTGNLLTKSSRKTSKQRVIKGNTREELIKKWFAHFQNLRSKEHSESNGREDKEMDKALYNLQIKNGDFTIQEFESES